MKKILSFFTFLLLFSCGEEIIQNNCFRGIQVNEILDLSLPEFINLQVDSGNVKTILPNSGRNIIIVKRSATNIKAFDLECPEKNCTTPMTFDGLKLICSCTNKEYNSLNGSPIDGEGCFALEYNVLQLSNASLQISR